MADEDASCIYLDERMEESLVAASNSALYVFSLRQIIKFASIRLLTYIFTLTHLLTSVHLCILTLPKSKTGPVRLLKGNKLTYVPHQIHFDEKGPAKGPSFVWITHTQNASRHEH